VNVASGAPRIRDPATVRKSKIQNSKSKIPPCRPLPPRCLQACIKPALVRRNAGPRLAYRWVPQPRAADFAVGDALGGLGLTGVGIEGILYHSGSGSAAASLSVGLSPQTECSLYMRVVLISGEIGCFRCCGGG